MSVCVCNVHVCKRVWVRLKRKIRGCAFMQCFLCATLKWIWVCFVCLGTICMCVFAFGRSFRHICLCVCLRLGVRFVMVCLWVCFYLRVQSGKEIWNKHNFISPYHYIKSWLTWSVPWGIRVGVGGGAPHPPKWISRIPFLLRPCYQLFSRGRCLACT